MKNAETELREVAKRLDVLVSRVKPVECHQYIIGLTLAFVVVVVTIST